MFWSVLVFTLFCVTQTRAETKYGSDCITSNNEQGKCMPVLSCANILAAVERLNQNYKEDDAARVRSAYCGTFNNVHHVCCANNQVQLNSEGLKLLSNETCGMYRFPKVAYGLEADLFAFPWMALLKYNTGRTFRCGGSLINNRYVLTAAHCVYRLENILTEVRLGEYKISTEIDCMKRGRKTLCAGPVEDVPIEKFIVHETYRRENLQNDIALIRLNRTIDFKRHIRPICLPVTAELMTQEYDEYIVSGWGTTELGDSSDVLLWQTVPSRRRADCEKAFKIHLSDGQLCAGGIDRIDSCKGDSGGPLKQITISGSPVRMVQFGIVSAGVNTCGEFSLPGVYTNVAHYMQWITDNMYE